MNINEIFTSLSGEPDGFSNQGGLATFVRLQGCNLACTWCDTQDAIETEGYSTKMDVKEVAEQCTNKHVLITGGEPLLQLEEVTQLIDLLCPDGRREHLVTIETNGSIPLTIDPAHDRYETLRWVVDYKLDSSGMSEYMLPEVFGCLFELDVIKFVMKDLPDYRQAKELICKNQWSAKKVFSPIAYGDWPAVLAREMIKDKLEDATLSLQLHRLLDVK